MRLVSTNGRAAPVSFRRALFESLAPDGGLFTPEHLPQLTDRDLEDLRGADTPTVARAVARHLLTDEFEAELLDRVVDEALDFAVPLVELDDGIRVLELFHGPTLAFKDVGARFMARLMRVAREPDQPLTVLVATSGDTGSAVAHAFLGLEGTRIVVLFPDGQVSPLQERQFSTLGDNVQALAVQGSFDDCQRLAKAAFADPGLCERVPLTSANSINIGRLLPQIFYYLAAWAQLPVSERELVICTPSGNFGNLTAGLMAKRIGMPAAGFIAATNANDVVPCYLLSGRYEPRPSIRTISNAMDVGDPSNLVRILHLYDNDLDRLRSELAAFSHDDEATRGCIRELYDRTGTILDPHTAVGYLGLQRSLETSDGEVDAILLATAHPAKFGDVIRDVLGVEIPLPERLAACLARERRVTPIEPRLEDLKRVLLAG
jgi:threonine synthase